MLIGVTVAAIVAFITTTVFYATDLLGHFDRGASLGRSTMAVALLLTTLVGALVFADEGIHALVDARSVFVGLALILALGLLVVAQRDRSLRMLGAFVAPLGAALMIAFLTLQYAEVRSATAVNGVLVVHIGLATAGLGAFVLASCAAGLYLVQNRMIRSRSFGRLFHRLPGLEDLDRLSLALTVVGFFVFSVALVLGVAWALRIHESSYMLRVYLAGGAWAVFALVLYMRVRSGWRGTQAAWLTIVGTVAATAVLGVYVIS